jgi:hypothetical protein
VGLAIRGSLACRRSEQHSKWRSETGCQGAAVDVRNERLPPLYSLNFGLKP